MFTQLLSVAILFSAPRYALSYSENKIPDDLLQMLQDDPASNLPDLVHFIFDDILSFQLPSNNESACGADWSSLGDFKQMVKIFGDIGFPVSKRAIAVDSFGKPRTGFFRGNMKYGGNFDECINIDTHSLDFSIQYCQLGIKINIISNTTMFPLQFSEAMCIPASCSLSDFNGSLPVVNYFLKKLHIPVDIEMNSFVCISQDGLELSVGTWIMIVISCLFLALSLIATISDVSMYIYWFLTTRQCDTSLGVINDNLDYGKSEMYESSPLLGRSNRSNRCLEFFIDVLKGFSLYKTVPAVLSTKQPPSAITSINGMRVVSMFWVIMCHTYIFNFGGEGFSNQYDIMTYFVARFSSQSILNGFFSVDSFFFLSGLLVAYLTFRQMKRSRGRFPFAVYYIHRILRLTPTYMFVLFFYWFVTVHMGTGPSLINSIGPDSIPARNCRSYWWTNLLYINNLHPNKLEEECMGWSWYLANDMQFYVISPLLLIPLYYWFPSGLIAICLVLLSSVGVTGFIAGYYDFPANQFYTAFGGSQLPPGFPDQGSQIYVKPYCRITPYLVGIFLGYLLFRKFRIPVKDYVSGWIIHILLWLIAAALGIVNVYGLYFTWHGYKFSLAENVMYFMFSRFTWGVTLALVVFICHSGYGGVINRFLSLPIWVPLSRMTFNAYLVHEMVMVLIFGEARDSLYYNDATFIVYIVSMVVVSYGAAAVVSVFVEYPLSNIETAVFKLIGVPLHSSTRRVEQGNRGTVSPLEATVTIS